MSSIEKRVSDLETQGQISGDEDFAQLLQEGRQRAAGGKAGSQTFITREMLDDPMDGEFWRQIQAARRRVRAKR